MSALPIDVGDAWRLELACLTGRPGAAPARPRCDIGAGVAALIEEIERRSAGLGLPVHVDARVVTERARLADLRGQGAVSCNCSCRMIETQDGWIALNLPRACDIASAPALIGAEIEGDAWEAVALAAREMRAADLVAQGRLLGLAIAEIGERSPEMSSYRLRRIGEQAPPLRRAPLVVDLSSLWAGPLCGAILADAGAQVVKIESDRRPDSFAHALPSLHRRLNGAKHCISLDFETRAGELRRLVMEADLVITSARRRALAQLGLLPEDIVAGRPGRSWVAVTAHGWESDAIGFGDDCAAAAGLVADDRGPVFLGDALADPIGGLAAVAGAFAALQCGGGALVDVSLSGAAAFVAGRSRETRV